MAFDFLCFEKDSVDGDFKDINGNKFIGAKILINAEVLLDRVKAIETSSAEAEGHKEIAGSYCHQIAKNLYNYLTVENYWLGEEGVALFTCTCMDDGCWGLRCFTKETDSEVIWYSLRHNHRENWDYSALGEFHFEKKQYYNEIQKLKGFSE